MLLVVTVGDGFIVVVVVFVVVVIVAANSPTPNVAMSSLVFDSRWS